MSEVDHKPGRVQRYDDGEKRGRAMRRWCYRPESKPVEGPASKRFAELVTCGDGTTFLAQRQGGLRRTDLLSVPGGTRAERKANLKKLRREGRSPQNLPTVTP